MKNEHLSAFAAISASGAPDFGLADGAATMAAEDYKSVAKALGDNTIADPASARNALMQRYVFDAGTSLYVGAIAAASRNRAIESMAQEEAIYRHAGITDQTASRIALDAQFGDPTPMQRLLNKFYFD